MRRRMMVALWGALLLASVPTAADARNGARADIYGDPMYLGMFDQGLVPGSTHLQARLGEAKPTPAAPDAPAGEPPLRVYVVVVDGMRPQQVGAQTPMLNELKTQGTWYEQARSVLPAETLPNHAAMATGVMPEKNGIIANQFFRGQTNKEYMQYPEFWDADTIVTRLERAYKGRIATATVLSKEYLYGLFRGEPAGPGDKLAQIEADFHWDPRSQPIYIDNPSYHSPDAATMGAFLDWIKAQDGSALPQFALVNLGDVDRTGHADESGVAPAAADRASHPGDDELSDKVAGGFQQAAITDTDTQIRRLVTQLKDTGAWDHTVLMVLSDHGMDWGPQSQTVDTWNTLFNAGYSTTVNQGGATSDYQLVGGGNTELVYANSKRDIEPMARLLCPLDGVAVLATRKPVSGLDPAKCRQRTFAELGLDHRYSPDIELFLDPGWHSAPQTPDANPLPGNHGSGVTQHSMLMVAGGASVLKPAGSVPGPRVYTQGDVALPGGPGVLSVAPTVAGLFGIGKPHGGYDAPPLSAAFRPGAVDLTATDLLPPPPGGGEDTTTDPPPSSGGAPLLTTGAQVDEASVTRATYTLYVANRGSAPAAGVVLTNPIPANTTFATSDRAPLGPECAAGAAAGTNCRWAIGDLPVGGSATVRVTYDLKGGDTSYSVANQVTAQLAGAAPASSDPSFTEPNLKYNVLTLKDTHVDRGAAPNTNYGGCARLELGQDNRVSAFVDADAAFPGEAGSGPIAGNLLWDAELQATVASVSGANGQGVAVSVHPITSHDWTEGQGACAGAAGASKDARTPGPADAIPASDDAVATTTAAATGEKLVWDVSEAVDTHAERYAFNGFELRLAAGQTGHAVAFHSTQAADAGARPRLVTVTTNPAPIAGCVDADPDVRNVPATAVQRIRAYATYSPGAKVTNSAGDDACTGFPAPDTSIGWTFDDDAPDAYIASLAGNATERTTGAHEDAAPNGGSTVTGPHGQTYIDVRLGDPADSDANSGTTRTAAFLIKENDGYNGPPTTDSGGVCEPGEPGKFGIPSLPVVGVTGCTGTGEAVNEDDVSITWAP